jgi:hypothetical protein
MSMYWVESYILQRKITEALLVASKENELEVNADKTKNMVMSRDEDAGRNNSIKIDNSYLKSGRVKKLGNNLNKSKFYSERK